MSTNQPSQDLFLSPGGDEPDPLAALEAREQEAMSKLQDVEAPPLTVRVSERQGITVVHVDGELELFTADLLRQRLAEVVQQKPTRAVVDLSRVSFIDSSGLGVLLQAARGLTGRLTVVTPRDRVARLFRATGLAETIQICPTLAEALA